MQLKLDQNCPVLLSLITEDRYAVAVMDDTSIVGHVSRKISYICYIFLLYSGSIICHVTGPKQYSRDLERG